VVYEEKGEAIYQQARAMPVVHHIPVKMFSSCGVVFG